MTMPRALGAAAAVIALAAAAGAAAEVLVPCPSPSDSARSVSVVYEDGRVEVLSPGGSPGEVLSVVVHPDGVREFYRLAHGLYVLGRYRIGEGNAPVPGSVRTWTYDPDAALLPEPAPGMAFSAAVRIESDGGGQRRRDVHWSAGPAGTVPIAGCPFTAFEASVRMDGGGSETEHYLYLADFGLSLLVGLERDGERWEAVPAVVAMTGDLR